jgi:hypothetical protein
MNDTKTRKTDISASIILIEDKTDFANDLIENLKFDIDSRYKNLKSFNFHHLERDNEVFIKEFLEEEKLCILIIDLHLGNDYNEGMSIINRIKKENQDVFIKIIVLSGHIRGKTYLLEFAKDSGADLICHKNKIEEAINKIFEEMVNWYNTYLQSIFDANHVNLYTSQIIDIDEDDVELLFRDDSTHEQFTCWYNKNILEKNTENLNYNICYRVIEYFKAGNYNLRFDKLEDESILSKEEIDSAMDEIKKYTDKAQKLGLDL